VEKFFDFMALNASHVGNVATSSGGNMVNETRAGNTELQGIQMLRAVAALAVVAHHALEHSNGAVGRFSPDWLTTSGASGVDIFFIISGFIMLFVSFRNGRTPPKAGDFLFRRATRIYPLYWICCLGMLLISAAGFLASHHYSGPLIASSLLLLPGGKLIGVAWTLVYEVYFYLLFAATLRFASSWISLVATTAAIAVIYFLSALLPAGEIAKFFTNPVPMEFCMGLGLAYVFSARERKRQGWPVGLPLALIGFVLLAIAPIFVEHQTTAELPSLPRVVAWGIPSALIVAGFLNIAAPRGAFGRFWILLGDASYALYLTHVFVMIGYGRLIKIPAFSHLPQLPIVPIIVLISIAIGIAAHLFAEKPLLKLIRQFTHRQPGHASPA
jgi:peptidoglycan/LPS O-acetylase OafA/YrhL